MKLNYKDPEYPSMLDEKTDPELENGLDIYIQYLEMLRDELKDSYFVKNASKNKLKTIRKLSHENMMKIDSLDPEYPRSIR